MNFAYSSNKQLRLGNAPLKPRSPINTLTFVNKILCKYLSTAQVFIHKRRESSYLVSAFEKFNSGFASTLLCILE